MPWLTLLVLAEGEFERNLLAGRPLHVGAHQGGRLPRPTFRRTTAVGLGARADRRARSAAARPRPISRGFASELARVAGQRRVAAHLAAAARRRTRAYTAFVVPTFEVGRKAGLGQPIDDDADAGMKLAWRSGGATEFPIYYEWYFRTGEAGDFEDLVERMKPRPIDKRVGIRDIDIAHPGFGMPLVPVPVGPGDADHEGVVGLEGALKAPTMEPKPLDPIEPVSRRRPRTIVNAPAIAQATGDGDPVIAPPLYGGWHALVDRVDPAAMDRLGQRAQSSIRARARPRAWARASSARTRRTT